MTRPTHYPSADARFCGNVDPLEHRVPRDPTCHDCQRQAAMLAMTEAQRSLICTGLAIAVQTYSGNISTLTQGDKGGLHPTQAARLAEQFERQRVDTLALIELIEP